LVIRDLVAHAPESDRFSIVGVDAQGGRQLGKWVDVSFGERVVRFMPVARLDPGGARRSLPHTLRLAIGIARYRPTAGADVVHAHRSELAALLQFIYPRAKHVHFVHGNAPESLAQRTETYWRFLPRLYLAIEAFAARRADRTFALSRPATERLAASSHKVVQARLSSYDGAVFRPRPGTRGPTLRIGWCGRFEPSKDPLLAVATLSALRSAGCEFSAWFAGSGTLLNAVETALVAADLAGDVELVGLIEPREVAALLATSDVFLITSRWEGMPRSALEALASGVPVVATDTGELHTVIHAGTTGFIATKREAQELAALLARSREIPLGSPIAATIKEFEVQSVVQNLYRLFPQTSMPE
jgi:glycosyltransferase involved in cell wall biosynthesis